MEVTKRFNISCSILVLFILLAGCSPGQVKKCPIETLVLDRSLFPENAHIGQLQLQIHEKSVESAYRGFSYGSNDVINWVDYWGSERAAKHEFDDRLETVFDVDQYMGPWEIPDDLYISPKADNYHAACGMGHGEYQCRLVATYGQYSVYLKAMVSDQWITLSKVNELLQAIDKRMVECTQ